jgi:hypothetical protein
MTSILLALLLETCVARVNYATDSWYTYTDICGCNDTSIEKVVDTVRSEYPDAWIEEIEIF